MGATPLAENEDDVNKVAPFGAGQSQPQTQSWQNNNWSMVGSWGPMPVMTNDMTFKQVAQSGLRVFGGWVREEFLPQLVGRQGMGQYREMMDNNAVIGGVLFAIQATMRKVEWRVLPPDNGPENQEDIDFLDSLRMDMSHSWEDFIIEHLSMLPFGFAPHEIVWKKRLGRDPGPDPDNPNDDLPSSSYDDGKIGWRRLPLVSQESVIKWFFDNWGQVKGMTQQPWVGPLVDVPIEKLLLFRPIQYKGNPEGRSILRSAWRSYYFTKRLEELEAISYERFNGLPIMRVPMTLLEAANSGNGAAQAQLNMYKNIATNIRLDEQMGVVIPSDTFPGANGPSNVKMFELELVTPQNTKAGGTAKEALERYAVNMMTSVLADFLHLGHSAHGTESLANQKTDMFYQAIEGYLNTTASVLNRHLVKRTWKLNGKDPSTAPQITPDLAQRIDLDILSNYVLRLAQSGMPMFPNEELQRYLSDAGGMPDIATPEALDFAGMSDEQIADSKDRQLSAPTPQEQAAAMPAPGEEDKPTDQRRPATPLEKMIRASLARRIIRSSGPRFGVVTKAQRKHKHRTRQERISALGRL